MEIKVGDKIPLVAHLECYESGTYYVDAIIKKPDRTNLVAPVDLGHEGSGIYFDSSVTMPNEEFLTVTYRVFDDAGKTIPSNDFCQTTELVIKAIDVPVSNPSFITSYEVETMSDKITTEIEQDVLIVDAESDTIESVELQNEQSISLETNKIEVVL